MKERERETIRYIQDLIYIKEREKSEKSYACGVLSAHTCKLLCTYIYITLYIHIYVCIYKMCIYLYIYIYTYVCMYIYQKNLNKAGRIAFILDIL